MSNNIYVVYKTTNLINGKYYIGKSNTERLNNGYLGSGVILKSAIKKYGRKFFMIEILQKFDNEEECFNFEKLIVDDDMVNNQNSYNVSKGGNAGPCLYGKDNPRTGIPHTIETRLKMSAAGIGRKHTNKTKKKLSDLNCGKNNPNYGLINELNPKYGRKDSKLTKKRKSEAHMGSKAYNSKKWFLNGVEYESLSEASSILGVSRQTISNWCKDGGKYKKPNCYAV